MKPLDKEITKLRIQVYIAKCGVCSRRAAMDLVKEGRVKLNGKITREPSDLVDPNGDSVKVDNKMIRVSEMYYILLHKPKGYVTTKEDVHASRIVFDLLPKKYKNVVPVGRLDKDTEGLLFLTNDGDLGYKLSHPKFNQDKVYFVRTTGAITPRDKKQLEKGLYIDGKRTAPSKVKIIKVFGKSTELFMTIHEGRNRQIRKMLGIIGKKVTYLKRVQQGPLKLGKIPVGHWRLLTKQEKKLFQDI
jgi:23S rRNA pseudouridine2605 synthase